MIGLDTNVLCRYLLADDAAQTRKAARVIEQEASESPACLVSKIVLCELVWVCESSKRLDRRTVADVLDRILHTRQIEVEDSHLVRQALGHYRAGKADLADYLIGSGNTAAGCERTVTFDRALAKTPGFEVL